LRKLMISINSLLKIFHTLTNKIARKHYFFLGYIARKHFLKKKKILAKNKLKKVCMTIDRIKENYIIPTLKFFTIFIK